MKLNAEEPVSRISKSRDRRITAVGDGLPTFGDRGHPITVTHPHSDYVFFGKPVKQVGVVIDHQFRRTILALLSARHISSGSQVDHPHAVADSEKGHR